MARRRTLVVAPLLVLLLAGSAVAEELRVEYAGELIDDSARPLGGVFALEFKLYEDAEAEAPIWMEPHYVAVVDGEYTVQLGGLVPLEPALAERELYVAVEVQGEEVLREPLVMRPFVEQPAEAELFPGLSEAELAEVTFAQLADRALFAEEAEHALDCDSLAGRTIDEIDRFDELVRRLADHQSDSSAHGERRSRLGSSTTVLQRAGGDGGSRYTRMCPTGYVVVGIRGGAGSLVDSIELICAPLE